MRVIDKRAIIIWTQKGKREKLTVLKVAVF